ncbi:MAG: hypothetical protein HC905_21670 [Bacteroidales bacterium]|nr:hypothetical protein [Bacteroidales bacterium]
MKYLFAFRIFGIIVFWLTSAQLVKCERANIHILYINSYNLGYTWSDSITRGIKEATYKQGLNLYIECLDAKRFGQSKFEMFSEYLKDKYQGITFNAVIVSDNDALDFAFKFGDKIFPEIPVVFCGINNPQDYNFEHSRMYGFTESSNPYQTIRILNKMMPQTRKILIITDNTTSGSIIFNDRLKLNRIYPYLNLEIVSEIDIREITRRVKTDKSIDVVYMTRVNRDKYGNLIDYLQFFKTIANASPKPVFADDEPIIGQGVVGGNANRGFTQGYNSGQLALKLLSVKNNPMFSHINSVMMNIFLIITS